jgi:hypothetical protein
VRTPASTHIRQKARDAGQRQAASPTFLRTWLINIAAGLLQSPMNPLFCCVLFLVGFCHPS